MNFHLTSGEPPEQEEDEIWDYNNRNCNIKFDLIFSAHNKYKSQLLSLIYGLFSKVTQVNLQWVCLFLFICLTHLGKNTITMESQKWARSPQISFKIEFVFLSLGNLGKVFGFSIYGLNAGYLSLFGEVIWLSLLRITYGKEGEAFIKSTGYAEVMASLFRERSEKDEE